MSIHRGFQSIVLILILLLSGRLGGAVGVSGETRSPGQRAWRDIELLTIMSRFQLTGEQMQKLAEVLQRLQPQIQRLRALEKKVLEQAREAYRLQRQALIQGLQITPEVEQRILGAEMEAQKFRDEADQLYDTALEQITANILTADQNRMIAGAIQNTRAAQALLRYQMEQQRRFEQQLEQARQVLRTVRSWDQITFMQRAPLVAMEVASDFVPPNSPYAEALRDRIYRFFGDAIGLNPAQWQQHEYEITRRFLEMLREAGGQSNPQAQPPWALSAAEFKRFLLDPNTPRLLQARAPYVTPEGSRFPGGGINR